MRLIETVAELRHQVRAARSRGERVGFVPTMGALHRGHQQLIANARAQCDFVVVSVYVNPTQFGPREDFHSYPRTPQADVEVAEAAGVDLLWRPTNAELYPNGYATRVSVGEIGDRLCGAFRPGHFEGVATVVTKLLGAATPDVLYVGEKDFQQSVVLRRLVGDLLIPTDVRVVATVRDPDGLAASSRNAALTATQRAAALAIPRALSSAADEVAHGERSAGRLRARAEAVLANEAAVSVQYVEIVDDELEPVDVLRGPAHMCIAAYVGETRLIDNRLLEPSATSNPSLPARPAASEACA